MANVPPATTIYTGTTGPGISVTTQTFTDVVEVSVDFVENTLRIRRRGANAITYYDYSAVTSVTWTISSGLATITIS